MALSCFFGPGASRHPVPPALQQRFIRLVPHSSNIRLGFSVRASSAYVTDSPREVAKMVVILRYRNEEQALTEVGFCGVIVLSAGVGPHAILNAPHHPRPQRHMPSTARHRALPGKSYPLEIPAAPECFGVARRRNVERSASEHGVLVSPTSARMTTALSRNALKSV